MEQNLEATVTVGTGLAALLLKDSGGQSLPISGVGMGTVLPVELANRFFEIEADGRAIPAAQVRVLSDGLEASFVVTFPRPPGGSLRLRAPFAQYLPAAAFCALVVTDDNNQMLGSHIVKLGSATADFNLPKLAEAVVATATPAAAVIRIASPTEIGGTPAAVAQSPPIWRSGALLIFAVIIALGGGWLVQRTFFPRTE